MTRARRTTRPRHRPAGRTAVPFAAGVAAGAGLARALGSGPARVARMAGSTIAAPDAAGWITDFLNAAYFRRARRPAARATSTTCASRSAVVTTRWHAQGHRRLRAADVVAFHRAFGRDRFLDGLALAAGDARPRPAPRRRGAAARPLVRGRLRRRRAARLGDRVPDGRGEGRLPARGPPGRRAARRAHAARGAAGPADLAHVPAGAGAVGRRRRRRALAPGDVAGLRQRDRALHRRCGTGGLAGQTFEIEVVAGAAAGRPVLHPRLRHDHARRLGRDDPAALRAYVDELEEGLRASARDEPRVVPEGGEPLLAFDLTTHEGHFMGRGAQPAACSSSRTGAPFVRAAGTWDPMPWHLDQAYRRAGRDAQHAFWGQGAIEAQTMLHQLATGCAGAAGRSVSRRPSSSAAARTGWPPRSRWPRRAAPCSCSRRAGPPRRRGRARRS